MKKIFLLYSVFALISLTACGQKADVPAKVTKAFSQKFPEASKVKWDKENDTEWEAEFKMNGKEYSANFSTSGEWVETEYEISEKDIPAAVKSTLGKEFASYKIEDPEISETAEGKVIEMGLEKRKEELSVSFDMNGKILEKEEKHENEDAENGEEEEDDD